MSRNVQDIIRALNANPSQGIIRPAAPAKRPAPAKVAAPSAQAAPAKRVVPAATPAATPAPAQTAAPVVPAAPAKRAVPAVAPAPIVAPANRAAPMVFNAPVVVGDAVLRQMGFGPLLNLAGAGEGAGARQITVEEDIFVITLDFRTIKPGQIQTSSSQHHVKAKNLKKSLEFKIARFDHYAEGTITIQGNNEERRFTDKKSLQEYIALLPESAPSPRP
jgi:hypothetical protein